jgi:L-fuculose-phosphate aldolase
MSSAAQAAAEAAAGLKGAGAPSQMPAEPSRALERVAPPIAGQERHLREAIVATAKAMSRRGLSPGRSGNVSHRHGQGMLITASGVAYDAMTPDDVVFVTVDGAVPAGQKKPSSEWQFHLSAYRARGDLDAIVHTHSMHATVLACAHLPIPAFHYMVAAAGGDDIPCVPYATFGGKKLAHYIAEGLRDRKACLLANHGQIAMGRDLGQALDLAAEVEVLAEQYYKVLTLGRPHVLGQREMKKVLERFKGYGQNAQKR